MNILLPSFRPQRLAALVSAALAGPGIQMQ